MKNFNKKITMLLAAIIFTASVFSCERDGKSSVLKLEDYRPNPCIKNCTPKHYFQVNRILVENKLKHPLDTPGLEALVFEQDSKVKGVCIVGPDGYVYRLAVDGSYQRQGVGKALLHRAMYVLYKDHEVDQMWLHYEDDSARDYYKKLGWQVDQATSICTFKFA